LSEEVYRMCQGTELFNLLASLDVTGIIIVVMTTRNPPDT